MRTLTSLPHVHVILISTAKRATSVCSLQSLACRSYWARREDLPDRDPRLFLSFRILFLTMTVMSTHTRPQFPRCMRMQRELVMDSHVTD